ncbi:MAG: CvpA family protein [Ruminococcus sp.]|nr:CvpA family protein [Ruminococcus sp.]
MKKRNKSNLDERQEQRLLRIERNGCWLAFWGLLVAMGVQMVMSKGEDVGRVAGEWIVFMVLACYMVWACMKEGIWDRRMKPDWKTNLIASLLAGVAMAVFFYLITDWEVEQKVWTAIVSFFMTFVSCYILLMISALVYKKRVEKLELEGDEEGAKDD